MIRLIRCVRHKLVANGSPDRIVQVGAVHRGVKGLAGAYAQYLHQVLADPAGGSRCQRQNWHVRELLLQHAKLLVVWPAP